MDTSERAIAVVGIGAILPDAPTVADYWQNLMHKRYSIGRCHRNGGLWLIIMILTLKRRIRRIV